MKEIDDRTLILPSLMLCFLDKWILGGDPERDLEELDILPIKALRAIDGLVAEGCVEPEIVHSIAKCDFQNGIYKISFEEECKPVNDVLFNRQIVRESSVLTKKGKRVLEGCNFEKLQERWCGWETWS